MAATLAVVIRRVNRVKAESEATRSKWGISRTGTAARHAMDCRSRSHDAIRNSPNNGAAMMEQCALTLARDPGARRTSRPIEAARERRGNQWNKQEVERIAACNNRILIGDKIGEDDSAAKPEWEGRARENDPGASAGERAAHHPSQVKGIPARERNQSSRCQRPGEPS